MANAVTSAMPSIQSAHLASYLLIPQPTPAHPELVILAADLAPRDTPTTSTLWVTETRTSTTHVVIISQPTAAMGTVTSAVGAACHGSLGPTGSSVAVGGDVPVGNPGEPLGSGGVASRGVNAGAVAVVLLVLVGFVGFGL